MDVELKSNVEPQMPYSRRDYYKLKLKIMKNLVSIGSALCIFLIVMLLPGCSAITGIFKAGVWTGLIIVAVVILLVIFLFNRGGKK